jgi:hypothetical protein
MKPKKLKTEAKASIPNLDLDMNISWTFAWLKSKVSQKHKLSY